jgi:methyl-accepting chemotaxis protein
MRFVDLRIGHRLLAVVIVGAIGLTAFAFLSLSDLHAALVAEREAKTKEHAEVAQTVIQGIARDWSKAGRPVAEAQRAAMDVLRAARYGNDQYFWVNDLSGTMLMHPTNGALEGTSVLNGADAHIFADMIDIARRNGGGFYHYSIKTPGDAEARPKISYVLSIPEWNWMVATGVYIDDINAKFWQLALRLGGVGLLMLVVSVAVSVVLTRGVVRPLSRVVSEMGGLAQGRLDSVIPGADRGDEIGVMARALLAVQQNLSATAGMADMVAQGNLTVSIQPVSQWDRLGTALKSMLEQLRNLVADTLGAAKAVHGGADTIAETVDSLAVTSNELSGSVAEITATMEELSASSSQISEYSGSVVDIANVTWESSKKGAVAMELLSAKMESIYDENQASLSEIIDLGKTSKEISRIMAIINAIADQTKLIAFNAALEAASAGEAGQRFGVVAAEIRRLADSVTESTGEIESKVSQVQESINRLVITSEKGASSIADGKIAAANTAERLSEMVDEAHKTNLAAQQISLSTQQQKTAASQVLVALREIVDASTHTARSMEQLSAVSRDMAGLSSDLEERVGRFRLHATEIVGNP